MKKKFYSKSAKEIRVNYDNEGLQQIAASCPQPYVSQQNIIYLLEEIISQHEDQEEPSPISLIMTKLQASKKRFAQKKKKFLILDVILGAISLSMLIISFTFLQNLENFQAQVDKEDQDKFMTPLCLVLFIICNSLEWFASLLSFVGLSKSDYMIQILSFHQFILMTCSSIVLIPFTILVREISPNYNIVLISCYGIGIGSIFLNLGIEYQSIHYLKKDIKRINDYETQTRQIMNGTIQEQVGFIIN